MIFTKLKTVCRSVFIIAVVVTVLTLVASYFLALFLGPALFFSTPEGLDFGLLYFRYLPVYLFTLFSFNVPVIITVGGGFRLLWVVFAVCLVAAWRHRESLHQVIAKSLSRPLGKLMDNCLFAIPVLASTTLVAVIAITTLQEGVGIPTGEAPFSPNPFETLLWLSYAAVMEEIGFRIIPMGVFLIIYLLWVGSKNPESLSLGTRLKLVVMAPLVPEEAKRLVGANRVGALGLKRGVSGGEWIMILATATVFGLTHYLSGGGWEIGKISSSAVVGVVMGLTYLLYGVQAPILLHWFFNYYLWFFYPGEEGGLHLAARLNPGFRLTFEVLDLTIFVLGVLGLLTFSVLGLRELYRYHRRRKTARENPQRGDSLRLDSEKFRSKRL